MKSVVALLAIVALVHAAQIKPAGLLGKWDQMVTVTSTADLAPPTVTFTSSGDGWSGFDTMTPTVSSNVTCTYSSCYTYYDYVDLYFTVDHGTDLWPDEAGCMGWISMADSTGAIVYSKDSYYCYLSGTGYTDGDAEFYIDYFIPGGTYDVTLVVWDALGNWVMQSTADGTIDASVTQFMIYDNTPDATMPNIQTSSPSGSGDVAQTIDIGTTMGQQTAYFEFSVDCDDNEGGATPDMWASGIAGVSVDVFDQMSMVTWTWDLYYYDYTVSTTTTPYTYTYGLRLNFYNWAESVSWTITGWSVWDNAGNMATSGVVAVPLAVTTMIDAASGVDVAACQSFYGGSYGFSSTMATALDVSAGGYDNDPYTFGYYTNNVEFTAECIGTETYYGGFAFMSPFSSKNGAMNTYYDVQWNYYSGGSLMALSMDNPMGTGYPYSGGYDGAVNPIMMMWQTTTLGDTIDNPTTGEGLYGIGTDLYFTDYWGVAAGQMGGSWMLYNIYTQSDSGGVKLYTSDLGSASSVVPSVLVVAVALVAAMLRL